MSKCLAVINIAGEHFSCDLDNDHTPLAHCNKVAEALWCSHDETVDAKKEFGK